jgi:hypothetical protein
MFLNERGVALPRRVLDDPASCPSAQYVASIDQAGRVSRALGTDDPAELVRAIDQLEANGLIPHAARMRIVLASRTGDATPLALARPVLERLEDRQFLGRLEEVAAALP